MSSNANPNDQDPKVDPTPSGDGNGNDDPNVDADKITLTKKEYDELKHNIGKYSKASREAKRELEELRKKATAKTAPVDDPDDDEPEEPEVEPSSRPVDIKAVEASWKKRLNKAERRIAELETALAASHESAEAEKLEFMFDKLLDELVSDPKVDPRQKPKVKKWIRDFMEVTKDEGRYEIHPKDGGYDPKRWLEDWLEEEGNEVFKVSDRKAGTGNAGDPDPRGKTGKTMTPQAYAALSPKERVKFLQENPEFRERMAGGMMKQR